MNFLKHRVLRSSESSEFVAEFALGEQGSSGRGREFWGAGGGGGGGGGGVPLMHGGRDEKEEEMVNPQEEEEEEEVSGKMIMAHVEALEAKIDAILNFFSIPPPFPPPPNDLGTNSATNSTGVERAADAAAGGSLHQLKGAERERITFDGPTNTENMTAASYTNALTNTSKGPATAADAWKNHKRHKVPKNSIYSDFYVVNLLGHRLFRLCVRLMIAAVKQRAASEQKQRSARNVLLAAALSCAIGKSAESLTGHNTTISYCQVLPRLKTYFPIAHSACLWIPKIKNVFPL